MPRVPYDYRVEIKSVYSESAKWFETFMFRLPTDGAMYLISHRFTGDPATLDHGYFFDDALTAAIYNDPADGEAAEVAVGPVVKAQAQASLTYGAYVASDSTGRMKASTTANDDIFGIVLEASSTAGDIIRVLVSRFNY